MRVRRATTDDDAAITALMESVPVPGALQLVFACRPSFFQALRVEGADPLVCVADDHGEIVGVGAVTFRKVFFNGRMGTLRYLSALRGSPRARRSHALARAFSQMRIELADRPGEITLTSILEDNITALRVLTGSRAGLPPYDPLCTCVTRVLAATSRAKSKPPAGFQIEKGGDASEISGFLTTHGPQRNFFPVCLPRDLEGRVDSAFPGLSARDFLVARNHDGILGVMGCWDVTRFRQTQVAGYEPWLRWARPWLNFAARCSGQPLLPRPGSSLGLAYGTLTLIRNQDPAVFTALLDSARVWTRHRGLDHFVIALAHNDPLTAAFNKLRYHAIHSRIFRVHFELSGPITDPDTRTPHFDGAML